MTADGIGADDLRGAMGTGAPLLEVRRLSALAATAAQPLLCEVSLSVPAGGVTAVVGPSGSGKTTLGLAALGAARPGVRLQGRALLEGEDLLAADEARRRALRSGTTGHLAQHPETVLDPVRRVGSGLRAVAALRHRGRAARAAAVGEALETAGLPRPELHRRFPHQLSGGEQQRAALASVLVTGPRLLVLDEPTSGLDSPAAVALARRLRALADAGTGLLLLSHDLALVRESADRVAVLEGGRVVEEGPARQVLAAGEGRAHPLTRGLLTAERRAGAAAYGRGSAGGSGAEAEHSGEGVAAAGVTVRGRDGGHLLRGPVTLSFPPGSTTALTGPSGSGKTTFGRVLAGLTPATTGEATYGGARLPSRIQRRTAAQRRAVQYVHQSSSESFEARAPLLGQLAAAGRLLRGMTPEAAEEEALRTARLLGLEDAQLARTPGRLSGGQLQRCALVRAVLARPALLVCDEVTSALDVVSRERLLAALPVLLEPARTALLFISHDLDAAYAAAERAVVFEAGRCVGQGRAADVLRRAPEPRAAVVRPEMDPARKGG